MKPIFVHFQDTLTIEIEQLHNNNGEILVVRMDMNWIGIPREGFGFSNKAIGKFGTPSFDKMIFEIKENITVNCIPRYL
jgi:uncharacterized protein (DUF2141 family)